MKSREYEDAVAEIYRGAKSQGATVCKNVRMPDRITGQARQVDCWIEVPVTGLGEDHVLKLLVDAKRYRSTVDVRDVEAVLALGEAVGADKCILICLNGWTKPAEKRARFSGLDLRLLDVEGVTKALRIETWEICPNCENDYVIMEKSGSIELDGLIFWWLAGQCRECESTSIWCQDCGHQMIVEAGESTRCSCGHSWSVDKSGLHLRPHGLAGQWLIG